MQLRRPNSFPCGFLPVRFSLAAVAARNRHGQTIAPQAQLVSESRKSLRVVPVSDATSRRMATYKFATSSEVAAWTEKGDLAALAQEGPLVFEKTERINNLICCSVRSCTNLSMHRFFAQATGLAGRCGLQPTAGAPCRLWVNNRMEARAGARLLICPLCAFPSLGGLGTPLAAASCAVSCHRCIHTMPV